MHAPQSTIPSDRLLAEHEIEPMLLALRRMSVSASCGGSEGWFELQDGTEVARGCTCHGHPSVLDLESGTVIPTEVWMLVGQRRLTMVFETHREAILEMDYLDDKYRPAYLVRAQVSHLDVVGVRRHSAD